MAKNHVRRHIRSGNPVRDYWRTIPKRNILGYKKIDGGYVEYIRDKDGRIKKRVHYTPKGNPRYIERDVRVKYG